MNDNIDKNEIRRAIDRLQIEHPCGIAYDPAAFVNMEAVNTIKECVDKIARRMVEDTEINIICEFAKLYLEGVKPEIVRPHGEWIETSNIWETEDLSGWGYWKECSSCHCQEKRRTSFCPNCGADMRNRERKDKALENLASAKTVTDPSSRVEMVCDLIRKKEG